MSRIDDLRRELRAFAQRQSGQQRVATAFRVGSAIVMTLLALFALDFTFEPPPTQRLLIIAVGGMVILRVIWRQASKLPTDTASEAQTALQLEEANAVDLVAALQFSTANDFSSGSPALKQQVVRQVEATPLEVWSHLDWTPLKRSVLTFAALAAVVWIGAALAPLHWSVFWNRMTLGQRIYPRTTEIVEVAVNGSPVLQRSPGGPASPSTTLCPQGKPLQFEVRTQGAWPAPAELRLTAERTGAARVIPLQLIAGKERHYNLLQALEAVAPLAETNAAGDDRRGANVAERAIEAVRLVAIDLPKVDAKTLLERRDWSKLKAAIADRVRTSSQGSNEAVWRCELPRLIEPAEYTLRIGDGITAPARLDVAEIPVVELATEVTPPAYASNVASPPTTARQFTVLEGSDVKLIVRSLTEQPLARCTLTLTADQDADAVVLPLQPLDGSQKQWTTGDAAALTSIRRPLQFQLNAEDQAGYRIETPIRGAIRVRRDRPPAGKLQTVHRVVLPGAKPLIRFQANDDFGVARVMLRTQIERQQDSSDPLPPGVSADDDVTEEGQQAEQQEFVMHDSLATGSRLPVQGEYTLSLSTLALKKGDRLKLTAEIEDHRGGAEGVRAPSEPIYLEISDESGVLNAISEPDERSEQRLDDLIRRQLGIGDEP